MYMDPISDLLLRIKTGTKAKKEVIEVNTSKLILAILKILEKEGYIEKYEVVNVTDIIKKTLITLKYRNNISSISGVKQISKPGLRIYTEFKDIPNVLNGLGISIISTSQGVLTGKEARSKKIGGEVIAYI